MMNFRPLTASEVPDIAVDGSSYGMGPDESGAEVLLRPRSIYTDPFRGGDNILVLCDSFYAQVDYTHQEIKMQPHPTNTRALCEDVLNRADEARLLFSIEQEFATIGPGIGSSNGSAWPHSHLPDPSSPFLTHPCLVQEDTLAQQQRAKVRRVAERHLKTCLQAGIEVTESQQQEHGVCSYKLVAASGLQTADQLWMSRFFLLRISDEEGVQVSFDPSAPVKQGGARQARCFVKYSSADTRREGSGILGVQQHLELLHGCHPQHMMVYGKKLPSSSCPSSIGGDSSDRFSVGVGGNRAASSVFIPAKTLLHRCGHYVDCRPLANMDPYLVFMMMASTTLLLPLPVPPPPPPSSPSSFPAKHRSHSSGGNSATLVHLPPSSLPIPCPGKQSAGNFSRGYSECWPSLSCSSDAGLSSVNSEDLLIDELERIDASTPQFESPLLPTNLLQNTYSSGSLLMEQDGEENVDEDDNDDDFDVELEDFEEEDESCGSEATSPEWFC